MRRREPRTLQDLAAGLPSFGSRQAVGLRDDLGLRWSTYDRLHGDARRAAALLRERGVGKGDRVLMRGRNSPEWVAFFFGAMLRGAVVVPVDYDSPPELVQRIAADANAKTTVDTTELSALTSLAEDLDVVTVEPSDAAIIFYTSGTTAAPRGVVLTHANVMSQVAAFRRFRPLARTFGARMLVMAPFSHVQGFVLGIIIPLSLGLSVIYTHLTHPAHLVRILRDNRVLFFSTLPRVLHVMAKFFESQPYGRGPDTLGDKLRKSRLWIVQRHYAFTHTRRVLGYAPWVIFVGGSPLPAPDERFWRLTGFRIVQGYGLTETTAIVSVNAPLLGSFGSVGRVVGDQEVRLADDGEILVRGPNVAGNDFLPTGDIGRLDSRKRLFIIGRKKELIVTGEGFNVYPSDVESVLRGFDEVDDCIVAGVERDGHSEVHAVLLLRDGGDPATVIARANELLLPHQRVRSWTRWPGSDLPRTALMKPKRRDIVEAIGRGTLAELSAAAALPEQSSRVAEVARAVATGSDDRLSLVRDLGLSSLETVELIALLEQQTGRALDRIPIDDKTTVADLRELVADPAPERHLRPLHATDSPRWPELPVVQFARQLVSPAILNAMVHARNRLRVEGLEHLASLEGPIVLAGTGHEHGFDVLLTYAALPPHLRRRLAAVTSRWVFTHYLEPEPTTTWRQRLAVGLGYRLLVPFFFPVVLSSHHTRSRDTLLDACRVIDRGYSLLAFNGRGLAVVARQCGVPIVPVRLHTSPRNRRRLGRTDALVEFAAPIDARAVPEQELAAMLAAR